MEGRLTGRVKWFNVQNGFGFITPSNPIDNADDIFVHHTSLIVTKDQYKYLVEGEYVEFTLEEVNTREHSFHAVDITGINRGILMCETRNNSIENARNHSQKRSVAEHSQRTTSTRTTNSNRTVSSGRTASTDGFEYPRQKRVSKKI